MKTNNNKLVKSRQSREARSRCLKQWNPGVCRSLERTASRLRTPGMTALKKPFYDIGRGNAGRLILWCLLASAYLLSGCGYSVHRQSELPFSEIQIGAIVNKSLEPKLQDKLYKALTEEFMQNGIMVRAGADTKLTAVIKDFDMKILSEKDDITVQYRIFIRADFSIVYKNGKTELKNMDTPFIVSLTASNALNKLLATKELAEDQAMRDLAMRLVGTLIY